MKAYSLSANLKRGLFVFAILIALASIVYTNQLVSRMRTREHFLMRIWATAVEEIGKTQPYNPYEQEFSEMIDILERPENAQLMTSPDRIEDYKRALWWARAMPPAGESYLASLILAPVDTSSSLVNFGIPSVVTDSTNTRAEFWRNVGIPDTLDLSTLSSEDSIKTVLKLLSRAESMSEENPPIRIVQEFGSRRLVQNVHFSESQVIRELRLFPLIQLLFVSLFILVGYLGFSYVRRSEQSSLWVGMAKEAAHQLGTPISSLMGWLELLRARETNEDSSDQALDEIDNDIGRLKRVASRFSDIGSFPKLETMPLEPVVSASSEYMRRRLPQKGNHIALTVVVPPDLRVPLNAELFEWVIENLLKNALDAIETNEGAIDIAAQQIDNHVIIDVRDTGKGIDRRQYQNIFRPGYSTKKRGWGLGLSLAKRIVEDYHGGSLFLLHSKVGQGSTFRIELPLESPHRISRVQKIK